MDDLNTFPIDHGPEVEPSPHKVIEGLREEIRVLRDVCMAIAFEDAGDTKLDAETFDKSKKLLDRIKNGYPTNANIGGCFIGRATTFNKLVDMLDTIYKEI